MSFLLGKRLQPVHICACESLGSLHTLLGIGDWGAGGATEMRGARAANLLFFLFLCFFAQLRSLVGKNPHQLVAPLSHVYIYVYKN